MSIDNSWTAAQVESDGEIYSSGLTFNMRQGIRPALYIDASYFDLTWSNITWDLNGGEWLDNSPWESYTTYLEGQVATLPVADNLKREMGIGSWVGLSMVQIHLRNKYQ